MGGEGSGQAGGGFDKFRRGYLLFTRRGVCSSDRDGLVTAGILANDLFRWIMGFSDAFEVDKNSPRVEVTIDEVFDDEANSDGSQNIACATPRCMFWKA